MHQPNQHMHDLCKNHMHSYVLLEISDGSVIDGIITEVDDTHVHVAVPNDLGTENDERFTPYGYGFPQGPRPPYGYGPYPYPYPGPGRFRRLVLPLAALTALSVLPWY